MISTAVRALLLAVAVALVAGPVAAGDPPPPPVAKASSGAGLPTAPPATKATAPRLNARAWALVDARNGDVLASHAASERLPIASTTKMMTAYLALQELPLGKVVGAARYVPIYGESLLGLPPGEQISVRDLLYGLILRSGNDAAYDLAIAASGSEAGFVRQMNQRAVALGLSNTHYANPIGLDEPGNYSSAADLTTLGRRLLDIPVFAKIAASRSATLRSLHPARRIVTRNDLVLREAWVNGIKTGHTFDAGYVLVGSGKRKGVQLISAVLGVPTEAERDLETLHLLDYGFSLYRKRVPVRAGQILASPAIRYSGGELPLRAGRSVTVGVKPGERLDVVVKAPGEVEGPIRRGAKLGRALVFVDDAQVASVPLQAARAIPKAGAFDRVRDFLTRGPIPIVLALFVILIGAVLLWRSMRRRFGGDD